jgi:hypothetical protein
MRGHFLLRSPVSSSRQKVDLRRLSYSRQAANLRAAFPSDTIQPHQTSPLHLRLSEYGDKQD